MSLAIYLWRRSCTKSDARRDAGLTIPDNIEYIGDIAYGPNKKYHTLDICRPKDKPSAATIINVHGGGYTYGSTLPYKFYCCDLAARGYTVVSFNYRLAPKYKFPSPLEDLNLVMQWVCNNADKYLVDLNNVMMVGDSAGAQLASHYATIWSNPEYADIMGIHPPKFRLAAVGLNCGMYDIYTRAMSSENKSSITAAYFTKNPAQFGEKLNVLKYITADFPPAYIFSSPGDFLRDACEPMAELLRSRGVECEWKLYGDEKTWHVFHIDIRGEDGRQANDDELAFMAKYIK